MAILKQSTAYVRQFLMVLSSDHVSPATGKTVVVKLGKAGTTGATAAGAVAEVDSTNLPGVYKVSLTTVDTNTSGDLWFSCTSATCDNTDFVDQVQSQVFTDLTLDSGGNVSTTSNVKKNQALSGFTFLMIDSVTGVPKTGLTVTAQRSLNGGAFGACTNSVSELSNGLYTINLSAADLNANTVLLRFTGTLAADSDILIVTQP